jgi:hypothetical protein
MAPVIPTFSLPTGRISLLLLILLVNNSFGQFSKDAIRRHIAFLADDKLEGRGTGTTGEKAAADYIAAQYKSLGLLVCGPMQNYFQDFSFRPSTDPHGNVDSTAAPLKTRNVVGFLDNKAEQTIIIGAHFDHLGLGHDGNSLEPEAKGKIHNGADDNASGVSGLLELARVLAGNSNQEKVNFLFIAFSGEEHGLFGSKYYADHPCIPAEKVRLMLNMDMIGRLDSASKKIMVYGVGTSPPLVSILEGVRQTTGGHLKLITDSSGIGPSDHTSFYLKNIPVLHFFTGQHMDYHKPSDDTEKINVAGQEEVLRYIYLVLELVASEKSLVFTPTRNPKQETPSFKVTLGIMPDYTFEGPGVRIDAVTKGRPASNAGLNKGDIILGIGEIETTSMQAYMKALGKFSKGDKTKVSFLREGNRQMVDLQF